MDGFLCQGAVRRLDDFDDEGAGHGLPVLVEFDTAAEGSLEVELGESLAQELVPIAEVAVGLVEGEKQRLGIHVVAEGEEARRGPRIRKAIAVTLGKIFPCVVVVAFRNRQR